MNYGYLRACTLLFARPLIHLRTPTKSTCGPARRAQLSGSQIERALDRHRAIPAVGGTLIVCLIRLSAGTRQRMQRQARRDTEPERRYEVHLPEKDSGSVNMPGQYPNCAEKPMCFSDRDESPSLLMAASGTDVPITLVRRNRTTTGGRRKLQRNRARDRQTDELLEKAGWVVLRVWEHEELERGATCRSRAWLAGHRGSDEAPAPTDDCR